MDNCGDCTAEARAYMAESWDDSPLHKLVQLLTHFRERSENMSVSSGGAYEAWGEQQLASSTALPLSPLSAKVAPRCTLRVPLRLPSPRRSNSLLPLLVLRAAR